MDKTHIVFGAGKSGMAMVQYFLKHQMSVYLVDEVDMETLTQKLEKNHITLPEDHLFANTFPNLATMKNTVIIKSPGISFAHPFIKEAQTYKIPIVGEAEYALNLTACTTIGITGTNGKTTTTALTAALLAEGDHKAKACGNIGVPLINCVEDLEYADRLVVELSSFQLEHISHMVIDVAAILNITPDHLDHHKTMEAYIAAKKNIFRDQGEDDLLILNYDDVLVRSFKDEAKSKVLFFSLEVPVEEGIWRADDKLYYRLHKEDEPQALMSSADFSLKGDHNLANAMAGVLIALYLEVPEEHIIQVLTHFAGVEHRMEPVREWENILFVNDSKGTNPDSTITALKSYQRPIVLICGGYDKEADFSEMIEEAKDRVHYFVLLGETRTKLAKELSAHGLSNFVISTDFANAVHTARDLAHPGDVVLLSPACASWDMFPNFEARGNVFKELVNEFEEMEESKN